MNHCPVYNAIGAKDKYTVTSLRVVETTEFSGEIQRQPNLYSKIISLWWRRLSVALQKGNAFMLTARSCTAIDANTAPHKRRQREPRWADFLLRDIA